MIIGVGIDVVDIARFGATLERTPALRERLFTPEERGLPLQSLAARFAAKEAVAKALGTGIGEFAWRDIEIGRDERGQPTVTLHGPAQARAQTLGLTHFALSLSHTRDHAIAFVVAYTE